MECAICYNIIKNSCIGSCTHHFCFPCLIKWITYGGTNCPLCKTFIQEIRFDKDFDLLVSKINRDVSYSVVSNEIQCNLSKHIIINEPNDKCIKITLENNNGPGVKIQNLHKKGSAFLEGLRPNDVIIFLNNIPCINHLQSIEVINNCIKSNTSLDFMILKNCLKNCLKN